MARYHGKIVMMTGGSGIEEAACHLYARKVMISDVAKNGVER
jgi:hypothetical protein